MSERRSFSRSARKSLSEDDRARLIAEMLGEDDGADTRPLAPAAQTPEAAPEPIVEDDLPAEADFDALDALDAEFDEELADIRAEKALEQAQLETLEHNMLVDEAINQLLDEDAAGPEQEAAAEPEAPEQAPEPQPEPVAELEPEPMPELEPEPTPEPEPEPEFLTDAAPVADIAPEPQEPEAPFDLSPELEVPEAPAPLPAAAIKAQDSLRAAYENTHQPEAAEPADLWNNLAVMPVDVAHLEENLVITAARNEPAHGAFDVLRTRLVHTLLEHGWKRVAITSPSRNCGKTFTAVNLAVSLSRYEANRTVLLDMDMRNPSVASVIGDPSPGCMGDFLRGVTSAEDFLVKFDRNNLNIGPSLAIGTNSIVEPYAAELAQDPISGQSLERMMQEMSPDIVLFDMPPALAFDDVIAFRKQFDGVLMVVGGGSTSPEEVREVMRRLGEETPLLGVVLNQAEGEDGSDYSYGS